MDVTWDINQGEDFVRTIEAEDESGVAIDLTGYTAKMQLRPTIGHPTIYIDATTENGKITVVGGKMVMRLESADINLLSFTTAVGDFFVFDPTGEPEKLFTIQARIIKRVTQWQ